MIYLDNAATTYPKPRSVRNAAAGAVNAANPGRSGHRLSLSASEQIYRCRVKAAELFGASSPENVIFTSGCTQAANMVIKGVMSKKGGHVVVSDLEHNAVMRPLRAMANDGVTYTVVKTSENDEETLGAFREALRSDTRLVVCTQISNVWGIRLPVERIAAMCRQYGIPVMIDAAQSAGVVKINAADNFDFVCIAGHKGLYAPMGTGILIAQRPEIMRTIIEGGTGSKSRLLEMPDILPDKFESGTPNFSGIVGMSAGIDFINSIGEERIRAHEVGLLAKLYDRLSQNRRVILYTKRPQRDNCGGVLSFNIDDMDSESVAALLDERGIAVRAGLHCAPTAHEHFGTQDTGTVRVSASYFTTENEIFAAARAIEAITHKK